MMSLRPLLHGLWLLERGVPPLLFTIVLNQAHLLLDQAILSEELLNEDLLLLVNVR